MKPPTLTQRAKPRTTPATTRAAKPSRHRLDRSLEPIAYDIELTPDLMRFVFTGRETIRLAAHQAVDAITLHAAELTITNATVQHGDQRWAAGDIDYDEAMQTVTMRFGRRLPARDELRLELEFAGSVNDKMHGFYRTSYQIDGHTRWGGATQFEATDARRAFPCWDEPDRKATFRLTLTVPRELTALSNMSVQVERPVDEDHKRITYQPSPRMSTYLLAWVIADLECLQGRDANGVPIRVWTTPGKKTQGAFALDVAKHCLPYFAKWFGIPYALPKLDMVALPDFASGAMENWGLVTYRETALLVDEKNSSAQARQRVAEVIDHELAHQWFGNLVTMEWWTDLWLNEGFASYMGPKAVDAQFPEWKIWSQFVAGEYRAALRDDSLKHSHPIEIPVEDPHEIREIFDAITYSKGSSVNRMLELYLTEPVFKKGLSVYLKKYAYGNARTEDLWAVLEQVSGKPVKAIMASYTRQAGFPVLLARPKGRGVEVEQRRFLFDGSVDREGRQWKVPVVAIARGARKPVYELLTGARRALPLPWHAGWVKLNAGQGGFYRTAYAPEMLATLSDAIAAGELGPVDCLGVLDDAYALARAGVLRASQALELATACGRQSDYNLWVTLAGVLRGVEHILPDDGLRQRLAYLGRELFGPVARRLGWERRRSDGHLDALLRALTIGSLGHYDDPQTIDDARACLAKFVRTGQLLPDIRGAVYGIVAEHGGADEYDKLLEVYRKTDLQEERVRVLRALTNFRQAELVRRALELSLTDQVRKQDTYILLAGFGSNPAGRDRAWEFVKHHWATLTARYSNGGLGLMTRIIEGATTGLTTEAALKDVRAFFARHRLPGAERTMKQSLEVIQATLRWARRDAANLRRWLSEEDGGRAA
jgi:puromycin-sensitive aminopeptidase